MQLKRLLRVMPSIILVTVILFGCLSLGYSAIIQYSNDTDVQTKYQVGIVGTAGNSFLELGMMALETFDSSRFAVEFVAMEAEEAEKAMNRGDLAAFVVIPEGFVDAAMHGEIHKLQYVSTAGAVGLVSMLKDEITLVIQTLLIESQKGIYGSGSAMNAAGHDASKIVNDISLEYVDFIFSRSKIYKVSEVGLFDGLGIEGYLLSGLSVVLIMLICLAFAPVMIRQDLSLARVLAARRRPVIGQVLCDFAVYMLGIFCVVAVLFLHELLGALSGLPVVMLIYSIPAVFVIAALSFFLYELASHLSSGVLLQFFTVLALCFVSGCLYPITFFPDSVQKLSWFLPTGLARIQVAACITGIVSLKTTFALFGYGCVFITASILVRVHKVSGIRR